MRTRVHTYIHTYILAYIHANRQTDRQTNRAHIYIQTDRQTNKHTNKRMSIPINFHRTAGLVHGFTDLCTAFRKPVTTFPTLGFQDFIQKPWAPHSSFGISRLCANIWHYTFVFWGLRISFNTLGQHICAMGFMNFFRKPGTERASSGIYRLCAESSSDTFLRPRKP